MSNGRSPRPKWADGFPANGLVFFKLYPAGFKKIKKKLKKSFFSCHHEIE
jgi:hypothetical protein